MDLSEWNSLDMTAGPVAEGLGEIPIATWDLGGDGPGLVLVHGTGLNAATWIPAAAAMRDRFRVWAVDLRGHGHSGRAPLETYRQWGILGGDLLAALDAIELSGANRPLVAAGHSMGAAVALEAEMARPGTFTRLYGYEPIVFDPEGREWIATAGNPLAEVTLKRRPSFPSLDQARVNFRSKLPFSTWTDDSLDAYLLHGFEADGDGVALRCRPDEEAMTYQGAGGSTLFEYLGVTECAVTMAIGNPDQAGPARLANAINQTYQAIPVIHHDNLTHFGPLDDPLGVGREIAEVLSD